MFQLERRYFKCVNTPVLYKYIPSYVNRVTLKCNCPKHQEKSCNSTAESILRSLIEYLKDGDMDRYVTGIPVLWAPLFQHYALNILVLDGRINESHLQYFKNVALVIPKKGFIGDIPKTFSGGLQLTHVHDNVCSAGTHTFDGYNYGALVILNKKNANIKFINCKIDKLDITATNISITNCEIQELHINSPEVLSMQNISGHKIVLDDATKCVFTKYENIEYEIYSFYNTIHEQFLLDSKIHIAHIHCDSYAPQYVRKLYLTSFKKVTTEMICHITSCQKLEELIITNFDERWVHILARIPHIEKIHIINGPRDIENADVIFNAYNHIRWTKDTITELI